MSPESGSPAPPVIWVVEDNDPNFELAEYLLAERGWAVVRARDGRDLDRLLAGPPPEVILLDMQLPGASGEELLARIRGAGRCHGVPVIALTAHAMRGDRERFLALGCDGYLAKPIEVASFVSSIESMLGRRRPPAAPGGSHER